MSDHRCERLGPADAVTDSPGHADASEEALRNARREGGLIINECALVEIRPAFKTGEFEEFLAGWQLKFVPSSKESAILAGKLSGRYLARGGRAQRVLSDFLIGAHALLHGDRLLARDRG